MGGGKLKTSEIKKLTVKGGKTTQKLIADGDTLLVCD